jgi:hypothetical protein
MCAGIIANLPAKCRNAGSLGERQAMCFSSRVRQLLPRGFNNR